MANNNEDEDDKNNSIRVRVTISRMYIIVGKTIGKIAF